MSYSKLKKYVAKSRYEYYRYCVRVLNAMIPEDNQIEGKEIDILALVLSFEGDINIYNRFNTVARKEIRERLKLSSGGLTNYIKSLKGKGILVLNKAGLLDINPVLEIPDNPNVPLVYNIVISPDYLDEQFDFTEEE